MFIKYACDFCFRASTADLNADPTFTSSVEFENVVNEKYGCLRLQTLHASEIFYCKEVSSKNEKLTRYSPIYYFQFISFMKCW
jgi:hypothetical protein